MIDRPTVAVATTVVFLILTQPVAAQTARGALVAPPVALSSAD
jgi:hypothetical protein